MSGAAVPEAKVVLTETARGLSRETAANSAGSFLFPSVAPGVYFLRVTKEAFDAYELKGIQVEVGQLATLQLALMAGGSNAPTGRSDVLTGQVGHPDRGVIIDGNMATTTGYTINGIATRGGRLGESASRRRTSSATNSERRAEGRSAKTRSGSSPITKGCAKLRGEFFNAFNHAQFGLPTADTGTGANFGRVTSAKNPRLIQLGMKLLF